MGEPLEFRRSGPGPENLGEPSPASDLLTEDLSAAAPPSPVPGPRDAGSLAGGGSESAQRGDDSLGFGAKPQGRPEGAENRGQEETSAEEALENSQDDRPGPSNTRSVAPASPKVTTSQQGDEPRFLQCRVDALRVAVKGPLRPQVIEALNEADEKVKRLRTSVAFSVDEISFSLKLKKGNKSFLLTNQDLSVSIGDDHHEFFLTVDFRAMFLADNGLPG